MAALEAPTVGRLRYMSHLRLSVAGAESNVAIGLARLGLPVAWIGRLGADELGELVLRTLRAEGVDVAAIVRDHDAPTGLMLKEHRAGGVDRVVYYRAKSAGSRLASGDIDTAVLKKATLLHVTGVTLALGEAPRNAVRDAIRLARQTGAVVSFDVNYRSALWSRGEASQVLFEFVQLADVVFAGVDELELLVPGDPLGAAERLVNAGHCTVVTKDGAAGASSLSTAGHFHSDAPSTAVVDSVGAGDGFAAGYLYGLMTGADEQSRLALGCAVGARVVGSHGDWEGLPGLDDLNSPVVPAGTTLR